MTGNTYISVGDIISLISLIIGLNAAFTAIILTYINRDAENYKKSVDRLDRNEKFLLSVTTDIIECVWDLEIKIQDLQTQCHRLLLCSNIEPILTQKIVEIFHNSNTKSQTILQELALFSNDTNTRLSASRQLAQSYGNVESIDALQMAMQREVDGEVRASMRYYLQELKERLNNS